MVPPTRHSADADKWTVDALAEPRTIVLILARFTELSPQIGGRMNLQNKPLTIFILALCALVCASPFTMGSSTQHLSLDHAATTQKVVALTFDADMTPRMSNELKGGKIASWYNQKVIATLRQERVPATLFLAGLWIERYPAVTQDLSADPLFEIGNHSYSHPGFRSPCYGLASVRKSNQATEVQRTDALLKNIRRPTKNISGFLGFALASETWKRSKHWATSSSVVMFTPATASRGVRPKSSRIYWFTYGLGASSSFICTVAQMHPERQMRFPILLGDSVCEVTHSSKCRTY